MDSHVVTAKIAEDKYPILLSDSALRECSYLLSSNEASSVAIVFDQVLLEHDANYYSDLYPLIGKYNSLAISGGIESKEINSYLKVIGWLDSIKLPRDGYLVAIGGGVVGDLVAFVASTYLRGVRLVHVPTTTTAMIDSSIGGKTGLNHLSQVNLIGSYYNPSAIFMDVRFLSTLTSRDYLSGIAEAIKMAITSDRLFLDSIIASVNLIQKKDPSFLLNIIHWSILTKLYHVSDDYKERSLRLILNYGHTFGQCIETYYGLYQDFVRHGEAVSLGMICAAYFGSTYYSTSASTSVYHYTKSILESIGLPLRLSDCHADLNTKATDLSAFFINDKKRISTGNRLVLCNLLGSAEVVQLHHNDLILVNQAFENIL
jgi:3-dehydroquinate synthetase